MADPFIQLRGISKRFGGVQAVDGVSLAIEPGTIHGLVGENGAGKSTLGRILGGVIPFDAGELLIDGRPTAFRSPRSALADGIAVIAQELALVPAMSVAENVFLGTGAGADKRRLRRRYAELEERAAFGVPADAAVGTLTVADQQKVEILRAIARDARLIVFDEPTSSLTGEEAEKLHGLVRRLKAEGITVIYVTHFLEEILALADRVSVMRNGRLVETVAAKDATVESLIRAMLGRELSAVFPDLRPVDADAPVGLRVAGLSRAGVIDEVSFEVRKGEIVGLAGLVGSGRSETARAIFGADRVDAGTVEVDGEAIRLGSPRAAVRAGIGFAPEDRKNQGLLMDLSQRVNMTLPHLRRLSRAGIPQAKRERRISKELLEGMRVTPATPEKPVRTLSGGNQQKVLIGKWLLREPRVIILDEPTRGVDVGAKQAVYQIIAGLAERGMAVVVISSQLEEVLNLSHRVLVMREGRINGEFRAEGLSEEAVMHAAFGIEHDGRPVG